jgi:hypothetical protein
MKQNSFRKPQRNEKHVNYIENKRLFGTKADLMYLYGIVLTGITKLSSFGIASIFFLKWMKS